jgi:TatD DNase family protein
LQLVKFKMKFIDAHVHLSDAKYSECIDELVAEAEISNIVALVSNSMNFETSVGTLKLADKYPGLVFAALGIHPWNARCLKDHELEQTLELITKHKQSKTLVAIGEIGLDRRYGKMIDKQLVVFKEMLRLAEQLALPVILHSYCAVEQIIQMLPSYNLKKVLFHWFSHPLSALSQIAENGFSISEGPPVAYSKGIQDVVKKIPLTNFLTETDGPVVFKKPPFNSARTTPAFIPTVVRTVAEIKNMNVVDVSEQIIKNFEEFFSTKLEPHQEKGN